MATKLFIIRHGSTDWNVKQRYCGFVDVSLNNKGITQARRLGKRLKDETVHKVYSSDKKRSVETARIVFKGHSIEKDKGLREMNFGVFEGLTYKQIIKRFPDVYKKWVVDPFKITIPCGENLNILKTRSVKAFNRIIAAHQGQSVAVVCHGGTISAFINHIRRSKDFWSHIPKSASLTVLESKKNRIRIKFFNDTSHLKGIKIDAVKFKEG